MPIKKYSRAILMGGWASVLLPFFLIGLPLCIDLINDYSSRPYYDLHSDNLFMVVNASQTIHILLMLYALVPLLLILTAVGAYYKFRENHESSMTTGICFATVGSIALSLSILMLPSINRFIVDYLPTLTPDQQPALIIMLKAVHSYFGILIGDFFGLTNILIWVFITSVVLLKSNEDSTLLAFILLLIATSSAICLLVRFSTANTYSLINTLPLNLINLWLFIFGIYCIYSNKKPTILRHT